MPIVDVQLVVADAEPAPTATAQALAQALGAAMSVASGRLWLRLETVPHHRYAENAPGAAPLPVFVRVLHADLPEPRLLAAQARSIAGAVATCLGRPQENVHIEYAPPGRGRIAFGGQLLE